MVLPLGFQSEVERLTCGVETVDEQPRVLAGQPPIASRFGPSTTCRFGLPAPGGFMGINPNDSTLCLAAATGRT